MPTSLLIGVAAGLAIALLTVSASAGGAFGQLVLFFLAPLPGYLAGLGWGWPAAAAAAVTSSAATGLLLHPRIGLVFLFTQGLPMTMLCHLALLHRQVPTDGLPGAPTQLEWYPIGRILAAAALLAGLLAGIALIALGGTLAELKTMMREFIDRVLDKQLAQLGDAKLTDADRDTLAGFMVQILPAASAMLWLSGFILNLWLAGRVTLMSGRLQRPWPNLLAVTLPRGIGLALGLALATTLIGDLTGLFASGFVGALFLAYVLVGLAIIHFRTMGSASRTLILWGTYLGLLFLNPWAGLLIALIGILEPLMWYRRPPLPDTVPPAPK